MKHRIHDNWYEDFFKGINCELWEKAIPEDWTNHEVDFLLKELDLKPGDPVLDIPCGFGRHAIALARKGFKVTGVDISKTFMKNLNKKIKAEDLSITPVLANILEVRLITNFSGALCMGNSFGYFPFDKMKIFIEKVSYSLEKGAKFIINSGMLAECILPSFSEFKSFTVDTITMEITNRYHVEDSFMTSNILYRKEGTVEEHSFKHYVFTLGEIKRLLKMNSLKTIGTYSSPNGSEFQLGDQQVYIVTEKE